MASAITATATATASASPSEPPLLVNLIPIVDLRSLSQSELYSLSLCSSSPSSFDAFDFVIPKIDRSVFNESAGSRKQTYSRLRLAPPEASSATSGAGATSSIRRRTPHLRHSSSNLPYHYLDSDPEKGENKQILALLKQLFGMDSSVCINEEEMNEDVLHEELVPVRVDYSESLPQLSNALVTGQKRKRGRPPKVENVPLVLVENKVASELSLPNVNEAKDVRIEFENVELLDKDREILNKDGAEVDLVALGGLHDPYEPELMRRTHGMTNEEELLEFMRGVTGRWGSTRKKRRIVDANEFGNVLPNGWSLLLAIKRKDGHVWLHCRRYISPTGRHFETFKEISSYLISIRGIQDETQHPCIQSDTCMETVRSVDFNKTVDLATGLVREVNPSCAVISPVVPAASTDAPVNVAIETGNLPAVQRAEVLPCGKSNSSHSGQNDYSQYQLSSNRRKKQKTGESVTDGVIIRDGKFECQFCHKTFDERRRYNGHVGAHVRYQGIGLDELQATPVSDLISQGAAAQTLSASENNIGAETLGKNADQAPNIYSPCTGEPNENLKETNDKIGEVYESMDVDGAKPTSSFSSEVGLEHNDDNKYAGSHDGAYMVEQVGKVDIGSGNSDAVNVTKNADEIELSNKNSLDTESCASFPLDGKSSGGEIKILGTSVDMDKAEQDKAVMGNSMVSFSFNEGVSFTNEFNNNVSPCYNDDNEQQKGVENSLPCFPSFEGNSDIGQDVDGDSARQMGVPKVSDFPFVQSDESVFPFSSSNNVTKMDVIPSSKHDRRLEFRSFFPYENAENSVSNFNKNVVEDSGNQHLLTEPLMVGASNQTYGMHNMYTAQESKIKDAGNSKSQELSLAYDSQQNCNSFVLERYPAERVDVDSGMKQMFGVQDNLSIDSRVSPINPKEVRAFGFDLHDSTFGDRTFGFENINPIYSDKVWDGPKLGEVGTSSRNFMLNFDGTNAQPVEDVMSGGIWRTREENMLHTSPTTALTTTAQSADCFRDFDVLSDKGGGLYGVNQKYDSGNGFGGLSLGRSEPVEHSFMTSQNSTSLPGGSKGFPFDVNSGLGFESSFWLGRDALMPNVGVPNQVPTVCMWCRNEFYQEPIPNQNGGAIGSMCPDCSSKVSSQFNM